MEQTKHIENSWKSKWGIYSFILLAFFAGAHLAILLAGLWFFLPQVWERQFDASIFSMVTVFAAVSAMLCFVEFFFHRYVMHFTMFPRLRNLREKHENHHFELTPILLRTSESKTEKKVESHYIITEEKQLEQVHFRNSVLAIFFIFYALPFALFQWLFPALPILVSGWTAIVVYSTSYEIMHALEHKSETFWISRFHQYHHLRPAYNMAIVGFFGFPLADFVFGTYKALARPLRTGTIVTKQDLTPPKPCRFIQWLDRWAIKRQKKILENKA